MPGPFSVTLHPLTPIWTGDANRNGSRIRETGMLGSLRWWYEAIIRGMNRYACDPTSDPCVYAKEQRAASICLVCQLFGCTGYGRRFRLVVHGGGTAGEPVEVKRKTPGTPNRRGWRIPPQVAPPFTLTFIPMRLGALGSFEEAALYHTLRLIACYGALGAKVSHGQGVVQITDWGKLSGVLGLDTWTNDVQGRPAKDCTNPPRAPHLADYLGVTVTLDSAATAQANWWNVIPLNGLNRFSLGKNSLWIPSAPAVRGQLRGWLRSTDNFPGFAGDLSQERHRIMGTTQGNPKGSDIFVTHLYQSEGRWTMRIFGFVPRDKNPVDQAVRNLLVDANVLKPVIEEGLGKVSVEITTFPTGVMDLLTLTRGEAV